MNTALGRPSAVRPLPAKSVCCKSGQFVTLWPSMARMMSPGRKPASNAGLGTFGSSGSAVTDLRGVELGAGWLADPPHHTGEQERKENVKDRAGHEHQHLGAVADWRQPLQIGLVFALDRAQVGELGQGHIASDRQPGQAVFNTVLALPGKHLGPEADGETSDMDAAAARGQEMTQFVDKDGTPEEEDDQEHRPEAGKDGLEQGGKHVAGQSWRLERLA